MFTACSKDDEEAPADTSFVGSYVIAGAELTAPLTLTTNEIGDYTLRAGADITSMIQQALFSAVGCNVPENTLIDLRDDNSLFMTCAGESTELNAGTWEEVSASVLKLNMNSSAIPSSPTGVVLEVKNITFSGYTLTGDTDVPLSKTMLAVIIEERSNGFASLDMDATPDVVVASITISFTKHQAIND